MALCLAGFTVSCSLYARNSALGQQRTCPSSCCNGTDINGDCQSIPGKSVKKGRYGFSIVLRLGDHRLVTTEPIFLIPYGIELPFGDGDF